MGKSILFVTKKQYIKGQKSELLSSLTVRSAALVIDLLVGRVNTGLTLDNAPTIKPFH